MLMVVSHNLVQCWLVCWIELFGCARVGAIGDAARCDKEGAAGDGAADGTALVDGHGGEPVHYIAAANRSAICGHHRNGGAVSSGLKRVRHLGSDGRQGQRCWARVAAAQDGAGHCLLFSLEQPHPLADLAGWPTLLQNAGHPIIQAAVLFPADGLLAVHVHAHFSL